MSKRDSYRPFCFHCSKQLAYVKGECVFATRNYHGTTIKLHLDCVKEFEAQNKTVTANVTITMRD